MQVSVADDVVLKQGHRYLVHIDESDYWEAKVYRVASHGCIWRFRVHRDNVRSWYRPGYVPAYLSDGFTVVEELKPWWRRWYESLLSR